MAEIQARLKGRIVLVIKLQICLAEEIHPLNCYDEVPEINFARAWDKSKRSS